MMKRLAAWSRMMQMLFRSWDINGRERFRFDVASARRKSWKNRRRGGKG